MFKFDCYSSLTVVFNLLKIYLLKMMTYLLKGWHVRNEHFSLKNIKDKNVQCACKLL